MTKDRGTGAQPLYTAQDRRLEREPGKDVRMAWAGGAAKHL